MTETNDLAKRVEEMADMQTILRGDQNIIRAISEQRDVLIEIVDELLGGLDDYFVQTEPELICTVSKAMKKLGRGR